MTKREVGESELKRRISNDTNEQFKRKSIKRDPRITGLLGPVHTNPFSNENGAVLLRITENGAIRKRSPERSDLKTMLFENAVF